ncbi:unnamed protein product [Oppiella nova]|uniref:Uncharacterized protein n=1 Tax=Oppiella nova TaxID=334625 RepID=A0A7R9QRG3_9ACAR|nr:unnamed protein product [Oppiella nova]CAG2171628.1 unnamed protein product [Oppiella nova]
MPHIMLRKTNRLKSYQKQSAIDCTKSMATTTTTTTYTGTGSHHISLWLFIITTFLLCPQISCTGKGTANFRAIEKRILDSIIGDGRYDSRIRPSGANATSGADGPALVSINIYVRSISSIDDVTMTALKRGEVVY